MAVEDVQDILVSARKQSAKQQPLGKKKLLSQDWLSLTPLGI